MASIGQVRRHIRWIFRASSSLYITQPGKNTISGGYQLILPQPDHKPEMEVGDMEQIELIEFEMAGQWYWLAPEILQIQTTHGVEQYSPRATVGNEVISYNHIQDWLAQQRSAQVISPTPQPTPAVSDFSQPVSAAPVTEALPSEAIEAEQPELVPGIFGPDYGRKVVTDGSIDIPFDWPEGRRGRKRLEPRALRTLLKVEWDQFTRRVVGWQWDEIKADLQIVFHQDPPDRSVGEPEPDQSSQTPPYEPELVRLLRQNGFSVSHGAVQEVVNRAIIRVPSRNISFYWVIGRPKGVGLQLSGGVYIFSDPEPAMALAQEEITPTEAIRLTINGKRVNFSAGWPQRARQAMYDFATTMRGRE